MLNYQRVILGNQWRTRKKQLNPNRCLSWTNITFFWQFHPSIQHFARIPSCLEVASLPLPSDSSWFAETRRGKMAAETSCWWGRLDRQFLALAQGIMSRLSSKSAHRTLGVKEPETCRCDDRERWCKVKLSDVISTRPRFPNNNPSCCILSG